MTCASGASVTCVSGESMSHVNRASMFGGSGGSGGCVSSE